VTDNAGNSSSAGIAVEVRDTTAPAIDALTGATLEATSPAGAVISYTTPSATDAVDAAVTVVCGPPSGSIAGFTPVDVMCTATDDFGNSSSTFASFRAVDTTAPAISAPSNLTQPGTNPAGEVMTWAATATDIVSGNVGVTCNPASGSTFGYAVAPVVCTATDGAGNTATSTFTVEITDATPPQINVAVVGTTGNNGWYTSNVTVTWAVTDAQSPVSSTGCDATTIAIDGSVTLTCSATSAGGTTSQSITIKRDATAPVWTLPSSFSVPATGTTGAMVNYAATADDATSQLASFTCAPVSGSLFAIGATSVNCTATDNAGLIATGTFSVTVNDTVPPVITATTPSASSLWPPNHQMVAVIIAVAATDNLGPAPVCSVTGVTSNEPQNGLGDGDTPNDWLLTGGLTLQLRAERAGRGDGRNYLVAVSCVDGSGNATSTSTTVSVPKSQSR
jgi:large repetitive protein